MVTDKLMNKIVGLIDSSITHIAVGTGVEPQPGETLLQGEVIRKQADTYIDEFTVIKEMFLDSSEANDIQINNVGLFGEGATDLIGSGELLTGGPADILKTSTQPQSITLSVEITVERV